MIEKLSERRNPMNGRLNILKEKIVDRYFEFDKVDSQISEVIIKETELKNDVVVRLEPTIISRDTEIQGDLKVEGTLEIYGRVIGNISVVGDIVIQNAYIIGQIHAKNLIIKNSFIQGDITVEGEAEIIEGSQLKGNLYAKNIILNGLCKGDMFADDGICLMMFSNVIGKISTKKLVVDENAIINGAIEMRK